MMRFAKGFACATMLAFGAGGCATTTSAQTQNEALEHQARSDQAAEQGRFGVAADEQKKAHEKHHEAVVKALKDQEPIPPAPQKGDLPQRPGGPPPAQR